MQQVYPVIRPDRSLVNGLGCWVNDLFLGHWPIDRSLAHKLRTWQCIWQITHREDDRGHA